MYIKIGMDETGVEAVRFDYDHIENKGAIN